MKTKLVISCLALISLVTVVLQACQEKSDNQQNIEKQQQYKIGVVDLMILKRQKVSAFSLAKDLGADGVEVDMGGLGNRPTFANKLSDPVNRKQFLDMAQTLDLEISSLAMTGFYSQPFYNRDGIEKTMEDCINTMVLMNVKVGFLPLGVEGNLVEYPERRGAIVDRLKMVGAKAEAAGVVIAIETALDAVGEAKLLDDIASPAIKICFNFSNPLKHGRNLYNELEVLGKDRIAEIHCTNQDGVWLQDDPQIDMPKVKTTLDKMGWSGWMLVERSRKADNPRDVRGNFGANVSYMKSIFQKTNE